jgi:formylglycine-generating enzyme required for sulfatase activity
MRRFPIGLLLIVSFIFNCEKKNPAEPEDKLLPPTLIAPINGMISNENTPAFDWSDISGAMAYELIVDDRSDFESPAIDQNNLTSSNYTVTSGLSDGTYYWKVRCKDSVGNWGGWSGAWSLTITTMIFVQGGTYQMGDTFGGGDNDQKPVHMVTVSSFKISIYEVTQGQWRSVMGSNPSRFNGNESLPVECVNWYDAVNFCNALSQTEGLTPYYTINGTDVSCDFNSNGYRLPTEAEWEYAAKGGGLSGGYMYSGSDSLNDVAWYVTNSGGQTHPVGTKSPNELGLYDMSGNVWEWCWDWYGEDYYSYSPSDNPRGLVSGEYRVLRGGSWDSYTTWCRCSFRNRDLPIYRGTFIGFRCVRNP